MPPRYRERHVQMVAGFGETGVTARAGIAQGEIDAMRADGAEFPVEASISIKFTPSGSVTTCLDHGHDGGQMVTAIRVSDTGVRSRTRRIFSAFRRADGSPTRKYEGSGLGLYLAAKIADLIKCRIDVVSEVGICSTFTLKFDSVPVAAVEQTGARAIQH